MKNQLFRIIALCTILCLWVAGCAPATEVQPTSPTQLGLPPSGTERNESREEPAAPVSWTFPKPEPGSIGFALQALGVTVSNGMTFAGGYGEPLPDTGWQTHMDVAHPEVQKALADLLKLKMHPDATLIEQAVPRPEMSLYAGLVQTDRNKEFYGIRLDFPQKQIDAGSFQIQLIEHQIDSIDTQYAACQKADGSWGWDWESTAQAGATVFRIEGLATWYQTYAATLRDLQEKQGAPGEWIRYAQDSFRMPFSNQGSAAQIKTVRDLLVQAGCDAAYPSWLINWNQDLSQNFFRGSSEGAGEQTPWSPLKAEGYQSLLDLPVVPGEPAEDVKSMSQMLVFALGISTKPIPDAAGGRGRDWVYLLHDRTNPGDQVYFVQWQNWDEYDELDADHQGRLQRNRLERTEQGKLIHPLSRSWKVVGFQNWLEQYVQTLRENGEWIANPS